MVNINVLETFYDLKAHVERRAGSTFHETEARAAEIEAALPGYVTVCTIEEAEAKKSGKPLDYGKFTVAQLKDICARRGIDVPRNAKKAEIVALLED